jgi:hypothetical protein
MRIKKLRCLGILGIFLKHENSLGHNKGRKREREGILVARSKNNLIFSSQTEKRKLIAKQNLNLNPKPGKKYFFYIRT